MAVTRHIVILMAEAGFGHRSAARAIAAALQELYGEQCAVEILNSLNDQRSPAVLRNMQTDYDKAVVRVLDLYRLGYQVTDAPVPTALLDGALMVGLFRAFENMLRRQQPDAIVVVYPVYLAPLAAVLARNRCYIPVITAITDLITVHQMWFNPISDLCLVPTPEVQDLAVAAGLAAGKVKVTGVPVNPQLGKETRAPSALRAELGWQPDLATVLVAGSKRSRHLLQVLHILNHSGLPVQLAIVAGGDDELYWELQRTEWHRPAHLYNFVSNMPTLMQAADCVLCKAGGLIVSEALACGQPILLADVIEGQETGNAEYVVHGGAGERADNPVQALEILCHWLDQDRRLLSQRANNARRLGKPRAAYDIAEWAWKQANDHAWIPVQGSMK